MSIVYDKLPQTGKVRLSELLALLEELDGRGIILEDSEAAKKALKMWGYTESLD